MSAQKIDQKMVMDILRTVQDPELHQDLVSLNMIKDVEISDNKINVHVQLTTPACPLKSTLETDIKKALARLDGSMLVQVQFGSSVRADEKIKSRIQIPVKNIVAIASGKGGVGKSTVAANIAIALAQSGARVGLMDADIYGPNIPQMLGVHSMPPPIGNKLVPARAYDIQVISIGFLVADDQPIIWRGPLLHKAIQDFVSEVMWGDLDYLIVDLPPGTGDVQLSLTQTVPLTGGIVVSTPQDVALADARRGLVSFQKMDVPVLGIIENMAYFIAPDTGKRYEIFGYGGAEKAAQEFGVPFLSRLPLDPYARQGGDAGKPVVVSHPDSEIAKSFKELAQNIAARVSVLNFELHENIK